MPVSDSVQVGELAERSEGYSGAEIAALCREAALAAIQVTAKHLDLLAGC